MKKILLFFLCILFWFPLLAQQKITYEYAVKDTQHLKLDVYVPLQQNEKHSCMMFVFGGGFIGGARDDHQIDALKTYYTQKGWVVISIDYRLGMKGSSSFGMIKNLEKYERAIEMGGEDVLSATQYVLNHLLQTPHFTIDPTQIVLIGSSAGAISILQADYFLGNRIHGAEMLPDTFRYAGVMSFAGAIFSRKGKVKYRVHEPAPTLFCHGTTDQLVPYNKIEFFNLGMYGSHAIVKRFEKNNYPYQIRRYKGMNHEIAIYYGVEYNLMDQFIDQYIFQHKKLKIDEMYFNPHLKRLMKDGFKPKDMKELTISTHREKGVFGNRALS